MEEEYSPSLSGGDEKAEAEEEEEEQEEDEDATNREGGRHGQR